MRILSGLPWRQGSLVGVDIGASAVKVVELTWRAAGEVVARIGVRALPPESVVKGAMLDRTVVADTLRSLLDAAGIRGREVALSLPGNAVLAREITMPRMNAAELAGSIPWEAEQHIPFDLRDVNLDYQVVGAGSAGGRTSTLVVLLAAAKKSIVEDYAATVTRAGCVPIIADVAAFALQNAYEMNGGPDGGGPVALINAGASAINVNIVIEGRSVFTRDIAAGGNACTEALRIALALSFEEAEKLKLGGENLEDSEPILRQATENLLVEVEKTLDFFTANQASGRFRRILLSGGASRGRGFAAALAQRFDAPVERFDPFRAMTIGSVSPAGLDGPDVAATTGVAAGLALRRTGDR